MPELISRPIPKTAKTAFALVRQQFQQAIDALGRDTVADIGGTEADGWRIDFDAGTMSRQAPDPPAQDSTG